MNNIYLTGMPGSGKSAFGRAAAQELGKEFIDLDDLIEKKAGKSIRLIFEAGGESSFRRLEKEALKTVSGCANLLVATGGGIILDQDNINKMRESGAIVFIDRPLELLLHTVTIENRPLLQNQDRDIEELYHQRYDIYLKSADMILLNNVGFQEALKKLLILIR